MSIKCLINSEYKISNKNRGLGLENIINNTNNYYLINDIAVIYKKPTPIQVVDVYYPNRSNCIITKAYYKTPSTTDYNGIYRGKYIDFEVKENSKKTSFPLGNIKYHQINHLKKIVNQGGIGFIIIYWNYYDKYFLYPFDRFYIHYNNSINNGRKSILYNIFLKEAFIIKEGYNPRLDYLKIVDDYYF